MSLSVILSIIFAFVIILLFIPIGIGAKYENGMFLIVKIALFKFNFKVNHKIKKLSPHEGTNGKEELDKSIVGLDFILTLFGDFRRFVRKRINLDDFELSITFGTGEASSTAVSTGAMWALSYNLLSLVDKIILVKKQKVEITPLFDTATWSISASGIVTSSLAHIIAVAIVFVFKYFKYKKYKLRRNSK